MISNFKFLLKNIKKKSYIKNIRLFLALLWSSLSGNETK